MTDLLHFRGDFDVEGDLAIGPDAEELRLTRVDGTIVTLRNRDRDADGWVSGLRAHVIGRAASLESAERELRSALAATLDVLGFVTQARFQITSVIRVIEWNVGQRTRRMAVFHSYDPMRPPRETLSKSLGRTAQLVLDAGAPDYVPVALKWFRYGLLDDAPEDQFVRFWLALEVVAEGEKEKQKVPLECQKCKKPLSCAECGALNERVPMATQAIRALITEIAGERASDILTRVFKVRHALMHGRPLDAIAAEISCPFAQIVNEIGALAWNSIMGAMPASFRAGRFELGHKGGRFVNLQAAVSVLLEIQHSGDTDHPADDDLPVSTATITPVREEAPPPVSAG